MRTFTQETAGHQITLNPKPLSWIIIHSSHILHPFVGDVTSYGQGEEMALPQITQTLHTKPLYWMIIYSSHKLHPFDRHFTCYGRGKVISQQEITLPQITLFFNSSMNFIHLFNINLLLNGCSEACRKVLLQA
jgi:hypothetical protein